MLGNVHTLDLSFTNVMDVHTLHLSNTKITNLSALSNVHTLYIILFCRFDCSEYLYRGYI